MRRIAVLTAVIALVSCVPSPGPGSAEPGVRGQIVAGGTAQDPVTTLAVEGAQSLIVTGSLEPELRALAGAIVVVQGEEAGEVRRTIQVESYDVVEINGERPVVGVVAPGHRLVVGEDTLTIIGASPGMEPGSRIWITGPRSDGEVRVGSWGVIRRGTD